MNRLNWLALFALIIFTAQTSAEEPTPSTVQAMEDNSFLVEEAYNQEPGVVQHILTVEYNVDKLRGPDDRNWTLAFTQEWPLFSQTHQLSYTIPYEFVETGGQSENGIGDISLAYRYQLFTETGTRPAVAPEFSLILPTGDEDKGLGNDTLGYEFGVPVSKVLADRWAAHFNAGVTFLPNTSDGDLVNLNLGGSIIYAFTPTFNAMLELVSNWDEGAGGGRAAAVVISPGIRYAINFPGGQQLVLGIANPIGLTSAAPDYGVFLYFSFEHAFTK